jgi:hypothetical protein
MAKLLKFFLFVILLGFLAYIFVYISELDNQPEKTEVLDIDVVKAYGDSLAQIAVDDTTSKPLSSLQSSAFEDFTISVDNGRLLVEKSYEVIFEKTFQGFRTQTVLATDLNGNGLPEFWVAGFEGRKYRVYAFEYKAGKLNSVRFPGIMGRQQLGYAGGDSLYLEKSTIVHSFTYENDPYADISSGIRNCFYKYGVDGSFVLTKTLDLDNKQDE